MEISIAKCTVFMGSDGLIHGSFKEALAAERRNALHKVISDYNQTIDWKDCDPQDIVELLLANAKEFASILSFIPVVTSSEFTVKTSAKPKKTDASSQELDREFDDMPLSDTLNGIFTQVPTRTGDDIEELDLA